MSEPNIPPARQQDNAATPQPWPLCIGALAKRSISDLFVDSGPQWAAAIAYYTLLSSVPLLVAAATIAAYFVDTQWAIGKATQLLGEYVPQGAGRIQAIVQDAMDARGPVSLLSIVTLLWSGSRVFGTMARALNIAYDVDEPYGFVKRTLVEIVMLITLGTVFVGALSSRLLIDLAGNTLDVLPAGRGLIAQTVETILPTLLLLGAFFLIYRFVPRSRQDWRAALSGAVIATLLFLVTRPLFLAYVQGIGSYNVIYGSLSIIVILALWTWLVALILLFGGEVASHVQSMVLDGKSATDVAHDHYQRAPYRKRAIEKTRHEEPAPIHRHHDRFAPGRPASAETRIYGRPFPSAIGILALVALLAGAALARKIRARW